MRVDELIDRELYARGIELLERIVAILDLATASITIRMSFPSHERGHGHGADHVDGARPRPLPGFGGCMHCWREAAREPQRKRK